MSVELRFEDGDRRSVEVVEGAVLTEIQPTRYERGHRLVEAVALGPTGDVLARHPFDPASGGAYPCDQPVDVGAGMKVCP